MKSVPEHVRKLALQGLVMAWGVDATSGTARHISEVARGLKSNCVCASCGHPLEAVNPQKRVFRPGERRPFFRHHRGQEKRNCVVLASRLALRKAMLEQGLFELPGGTMSRRVEGESGQVYEGFASWAPEYVRIRNFEFRDDVLAILALDDGRQINVVARGTLLGSIEGGFASVVVDLAADEAAGMSVEEIRRRLFLAPGGLRWHCHWNEAELASKAQADALARARECIDHCDDPTVPPEWRRESALHLAVKEIIAAELRIVVPEQSVTVRGGQAGAHVERSWHEPPREVVLDAAMLEPRLGRLIPDVVVRVGLHEMLIEVTVSHPITDLKREILESVGLPVLEIDLRRVSGVVTRDRLRKLVIDELHCKDWAFHPRIARMRELLMEELRKELFGKLAAAQPSTSLQPSGQERDNEQPRTWTTRGSKTRAEDYARASGKAAPRVRESSARRIGDESLWLSGRELEEWKRLYPDAAADWEEVLARRAQGGGES